MIKAQFLFIILTSLLTNKNATASNSVYLDVLNLNITERYQTTFLAKGSLPLADTVLVTKDTVVNDLKRSDLSSSRTVFIAKYPNLSLELYNSTLNNLSGISIIGFCNGKIENITFPNKLKGTAILLAACKNFKIRNIQINGSELTADKIAILLYRCENIKVIDCHTVNGEWYVSLLQIKGGDGFLVKNCSVSNVNFARRAFYIRGDAPWKKKKSTSYNSYSSFHNLHGSAITKNVVIKNCTISNSSMGNNQAILVQESQNVLIKNCDIINSHLFGITIKRLKGGAEKDFTVKKNRIRHSIREPIQIVNESSSKNLNFRAVKNSGFENEE